MVIVEQICNEKDKFVKFLLTIIEFPWRTVFLMSSKAPNVKILKKNIDDNDEEGRIVLMCFKIIQ